MVIAYPNDREYALQNIIDVATNGIVCKTRVKQVVTSGKFGYEQGCTFGGYETGYRLFPYEFFLTQNQKNKIARLRFWADSGQWEKVENKIGHRDIDKYVADIYADIRCMAEQAIASRKEQEAPAVA